MWSVAKQQSSRYSADDVEGQCAAVPHVDRRRTRKLVRMRSVSAMSSSSNDDSEDHGSRIDWKLLVEPLVVLERFNKS